MPETDPPDLFAAAGVVFDAEPALPAPKRASRPRKPTPAQRAADVRREGARRHRAPQAPGQRTRVGQSRDLSPAPVLAFPLARNAGVVAEVIERLPHGYARDLDKRRDQEVKFLEKRLLKQGVTGQNAWRCARELVHVAYMERVRQAHKEAEIL